MPRSRAILNLEARINRLRPVLASFAETDAVRMLLGNIDRYSQWCATCSRTNSPGRCGRTCALLRPRDQVPDPQHLAGPDWWHEVRSDHRLYKQVVDDMDRHELDVTEDRVLRWELAMEDLRRAALSFNEQLAEQGWITDGYGGPPKPVEGMNLKWLFGPLLRNPRALEEPGPLHRRVSEVRRKSLKRPSDASDGPALKRGKRESGKKQNAEPGSLWSRIAELQRESLKRASNAGDGPTSKRGRREKR